MATFPGVRWDEWPDLPYELLMACIDYVEAMTRGGE